MSTTKSRPTVKSTEQLEQQWLEERARLTAKLATGKDADGWPLSPEAKDNLRLDIRECGRMLRRLAGAVL